jgi:hypothetical protein
MRKMLVVLLILGGLLFAVSVQETGPDADSGEGPPVPTLHEGTPPGAGLVSEPSGEEASPVAGAACTEDMDCEGLWEVCVGGECKNIMEEECQVECPEGEYAYYPDCVCKPLEMETCCGPMFALLAVFGFAASRKV